MKTSSAVVFGLGDSGYAVSMLLADHGWRVRVLDQSSGTNVQTRAAELNAHGLEAVTGCGDIGPSDFEFPGSGTAGLCIKSPGIPSDSPWLRAAEGAGVDVCSELDIGFSFCTCPLIAVTGSNGKSTLVKLIHETLTALGMKSLPCGNYGRPLSDVVRAGEEYDRLVVEVSTFQMEKSSLFMPQSGVLLNLQPNHLDRHGTIEAYADLKARMFANMTETGIAVVNIQELERVIRFNPAISPLTIGDDSNADFYYDEGIIRGPGVEMDVMGTFVDDPVMGLTAAAALAVVSGNGWDVDVLAECIRQFKPLQFRMQEVGLFNGVRYINNSKSTTLAAIEASLRMTGGTVRLVSGGRLKENDLNGINKMLVKSVVTAYVYGESGKDLARAWSDCIQCELFDNLEQAVRRASGDAQSGDIIMLSPGCTSFDQYSGYAERGRDFNRVIDDIRRRFE